MPVVKKTVAIHPTMDSYIRKTWAMLIEAGHNATYSTALNFMLLAALMEAIKEGGLSNETRDLIWDFAKDEETIEELNLEDHLAELETMISKRKRGAR